MPKTRLIIDHPQRGSWNMAVDQALLQSANDLGQATMRWYRWSPSTLSLGYFQQLENRQTHEPSLNCDIVRRASGGGAILHDQEWTYSITLPVSDRLSRSHETLVSEVHGAMIEVLSEHGIVGELHSEDRSKNKDLPDPFLCFLRRAPNDLIVDGNKVCGSAQRRIEGAILQHGSLLLLRSEFAPELAGVLDLVQSAGNASFATDVGSNFFESLVRKVSGRLTMELEEGTLNPEETKLAQSIEMERFANPSWTTRR